MLHDRGVAVHDRSVRSIAVSALVVVAGSAATPRSLDSLDFEPARDGLGTLVGCVDPRAARYGMNVERLDPPRYLEREIWSHVPLDQSGCFTVEKLPRGTYHMRYRCCVSDSCASLESTQFEITASHVTVVADMPAGLLDCDENRE
jgi:hypothetical protein